MQSCTSLLAPLRYALEIGHGLRLCATARTQQHCTNLCSCEAQLRYGKEHYRRSDKPPCCIAAEHPQSPRLSLHLRRTVKASTLTTGATDSSNNPNMNSGSQCRVCHNAPGNAIGKKIRPVGLFEPAAALQIGVAATP